jgi:hypothetical protein
VRDGERTKDEKNSARKATKNKKSTAMLHARMPTAMMHGGGRMQFMMMTKFAPPDTNKKQDLQL